MSLNIRALKDAVARWQTYEDRGIKPAFGWNTDGDGNSCALGDILHYEQIGTGKHRQEAVVGRYLGQLMCERVCPQTVEGQGFNEIIPGWYALLNISDCFNRWPIEEVQRLIAWEEASIKADNIADVEQPIFA